MNGRRCGRPEQEQVETEGDAAGGGRLGLQGTVNGEEDVLDAVGVEVGGGGGPALGFEGEVGCEGFDGAGDTVAGGAAEFDEVVRRGDGDQETAAGAEDAAVFGGIAAGGDGEDEGETLVRVGNHAVRVGEDPFAGRIAAGGGEDGGKGDIDTVAMATGLFDEGAEIVAVAAARVEDFVGGGGVGKFADGVEEGDGDTAVVEAAASVDGAGGIAGFARAAVLRLEKSDVPVPADVEGVFLRAGIGAAGPGEGLAATPDSTDEHRP